MPRCLIALGANIGDRDKSVHGALKLLAARSELNVVRSSEIFRTKPVGGPLGQQSFANAAALIDCSVSAAAFISILLDVEREFGRERNIRWQARTLDLDLLLYEDVILEQEQHVVPHPRMSFRRFVLEPAAQIAGKMIHPILDMSINELLDAINHKDGVIAVESADPEIARRLATDVGFQNEKVIPNYALRSSTNESGTEPVARERPVKLAVAVLQTGNTPSDCFQKQAKRDLLSEIRSPMLVVNGDCHESAKNELTAAIEAMH